MAARRCEMCRSQRATPIPAPRRSTTAAARTSTVTPYVVVAFAAEVDTAAAYDDGVSDAAHRPDDAPRGTSLLPSDLTDDQLAAAPVLASIDTLLIEDLLDDKDDAFAAALDA